MLAKATAPAAHLHTLVAPLLFLKSTNCHSHPSNAQTQFVFCHTYLADFHQETKDEGRSTGVCQTRPHPAILRLFQCKKIPGVVRCRKVGDETLIKMSACILNVRQIVTFIAVREQKSSCSCPGPTSQPALGLGPLLEDMLLRSM